MIRVSPTNWKTAAKGEVALEVVAADELGRVSLDVTARWTNTERDGPKPQVHWRAGGRVSTTIAREFAQAILMAADIADQEATAQPEEEQS